VAAVLLLVPLAPLVGADDEVAPLAPLVLLVALVEVAPDAPVLLECALLVLPVVVDVAPVVVLVAPELVVLLLAPLDDVEPSVTTGPGVSVPPQATPNKERLAKIVLFASGLP
jgi:uncharacterized membrane protein